MKQLQGLEKRIRGWFPQEPKTHNTTIISHNNEYSPKTINAYEFKKEATITNDARGVISLVSLSSIMFSNLVYLPLVTYVSLFLVGTAVGTIIHIVPARKELKALSVKGTSNVKLSETLSFVMIFIEFCLIMSVLIVEGFSNIIAIRLVITFSLGCIIANLVSKARLFGAWEKKNKADIMRGKRYEIISTPRNKPRYDIFGREKKS